MKTRNATTEPDDRCPNCGYCPHCGQATPKFIPYPYGYPYPYTWTFPVVNPYQITYAVPPASGTYSGTQSGNVTTAFIP